MSNTACQLPTVDQVRERLRYEPETGQFYWLVSRGGVRAGELAGSPHNQGYLHIRLMGAMYLAHRLAWLWAHGEWPGGQIDHINGDRRDNRIANLRIVTQRQNNQNKEWHRAGRLVGASYRPRNKRWEAYIVVCGRKRHLGHYDTEQEAHEAYLRALGALP